MCGRILANARLIYTFLIIVCKFDFCRVLASGCEAGLGFCVEIISPIRNCLVGYNSTISIYYIFFSTKKFCSILYRFFDLILRQIVRRAKTTFCVHVFLRVRATY